MQENYLFYYILVIANEEQLVPMYREVKQSL